jgi:hypothetical protein
LPSVNAGGPASLNWIHKSCEESIGFSRRIHGQHIRFDGGDDWPEPVW